MRKSIRNKLAALIFLINMSIIGITWIMAVFMFKPMYYAVTQAEISSVADKIISAIETEGGIT